MPELLIIPLLNKKITLFSGPSTILSDDIIIEKLTDDEHSAFFRDGAQEIKDSLDQNNTKCIKIKVANPTIEIIKKWRTEVTFTLNLFTEKHPVITSWGGHIIGEKKSKVKEIHEFESLAALNQLSKNPFKLSNTADRSAVIQFLDIVSRALATNVAALFTLEKYNSALLRYDFFDKLLDSTICFETMSPGSSELVHKLSENIAFIVGDTPAERLQIFKNMKKLYDVRSKLVHGDLQGQAIQNKINEVKNDWETYERYLKSAATYYLLFLSQHQKSEWETHLLELILGTQNKIV